jgi:CRP-like cAMP-binding protein
MDAQHRAVGHRASVAMRASELEQQQLELEKQALDSAIRATQSTVQSRHKHERQAFREIRAGTGDGSPETPGKVGKKKRRRSSLASIGSLDADAIDAYEAPPRLVTDPLAGSAGCPVVSARVLRVAMDAVAETNRRRTEQAAMAATRGKPAAATDDPEDEDALAEAERNRQEHEAAKELLHGAVDTALQVSAAHLKDGFGSAEEQIAAVLSILKRTAAPGARKSRAEMRVIRGWLRSAHPKLFAGLPVKTLDSLVRRVRLIQLRAGQLVCLQGFPGHGFFLIVRGRCSVRVAASSAQHRQIQRVATESGVLSPTVPAEVLPARGGRKPPATTVSTGGTLEASSSQQVPVLDSACRAPIFLTNPGGGPPSGYQLAQLVMASNDEYVRNLVRATGAGAAIASAALQDEVLSRVLAEAGSRGAAIADLALEEGRGPPRPRNTRGRRRSSVASVDSMWSVDVSELQALEGISNGERTASDEKGPAPILGHDDATLRPALADADSIGKEVVVLSAGQHFGELALLSDDDRRNATVVAVDEGTALVALARPTYLGSLRERNQREYDTRALFLLSLNLFQGWSRRRIVPLAYALTPHLIPTGTALYRRGEPADKVYFVRSGLVRLTGYFRRSVSSLRPQTDEQGRIVPGAMTRANLGRSATDHSVSDVLKDLDLSEDGLVKPGSMVPPQRVAHSHPQARLIAIDCVLAGPGSLVGEIEVLRGGDPEVIRKMGSAPDIPRAEGVPVSRGTRRASLGGEEVSHAARLSDAVAVTDAFVYSLSWDKLDALLMQNSDSNVAQLFRSQTEDKIRTIARKIHAAQTNSLDSGVDDEPSSAAAHQLVLLTSSPGSVSWSFRKQSTPTSPASPPKPVRPTVPPLSVPETVSLVVPEAVSTRRTDDTARSFIPGVALSSARSVLRHARAMLERRGLAREIDPLSGFSQYRMPSSPIRTGSFRVPPSSPTTAPILSPVRPTTHSPSRPNRTPRRVLHRPVEQDASEVRAGTARLRLDL